MIAVLVPSGVRPGRREPIDEAEQHHLRVRRAAEGERVALRDGAGLVGTGRLVMLGRSWLVDVDTIERRARPAPLVLAVGAGDRERFGWLVEKAAELGATQIVPLETERTAGVATRLKPTHLEKLRRQALEALKQCGAAWASEVAAPVGMTEFLARDAAGHRWLAEGAGQPAPPVLDGTPVTVVVGPEGGWSVVEHTACIGAGYVPIVLASDTLRFETAALAAAAVVATARRRGTHG